jgi:hypothetical protein
MSTSATNQASPETKDATKQKTKEQSVKEDDFEERASERSSSDHDEEPSRDSIARTTRLREKDRELQQKDKATFLQEEKRKANQARLAKLQAEIAKERYLKLKRGIDVNITPKPEDRATLSLKDYTAYNSPSEFPKEAEKDKVFLLFPSI